MAINITKVSAVILVTSGTSLPKSYFGSVGTFSPSSDNLGFNIKIGTDSLYIPLTTLQVNGQTSSTMSEGNTLLRAIFGT